MRVRWLLGLAHEHLDVLAVWLVGVVLGFTVQMGEGLGMPSQGLALSAAAIPAALVALAPGRLRQRAAFAAVILVGLLAAVNTLYHRAFHTYLPLHTLTFADQAWAVRGYIADLLRPGDLLKPLIVLAALGAVALRRPAAAPNGAPRRALPLTLSVLGLVPSLVWAWLLGPTHADHDTGGFLHAHVLEATRTAHRWVDGGTPSPEELTRVERYLAAHASTGRGSTLHGVAAGSNVLLIQVEALNDWLLDVDVEGEPVTPVLRSLRDRALYFTQVYDQTYQGRSSDADYLVMASQHALEFGAVSMTQPELDPEALPDILAARGYATFSAHAHHRGFWNAGVRHQRYGFQESLFDREMGSGQAVGFGLTDSVFFQRVAPRLTSLPQPFLGWLITLTMHGGFTDLPDSFGSPLDGARDTALGRYLLRARHTDAALGALLDTLTASGTLANTTVVVYGDHNETFDFPKSWVDSVAGVAGPDPNVRRLLRSVVPIFVLLPGQVEGRRIDTTGGLIDLAPTLLDLLGVEQPPAFLGRSLVDGTPGMAALPSGPVVTADLLWTGTRCYRRPGSAPVPEEACGAIRARARDELEVSWLITRYGLGGGG